MARELTCALCGKNFTCKGWIGCWCGSVTISKEKRRTIKDQTDECVCPACLRG